MTTVENLFWLSHQLSADQLFEQASQRILQGAKQEDSTRYDNLEKYLNAVIYGTGSSGVAAATQERLSGAVTNYLNQLLDKKFTSFDFGANTAYGGTDSEGKIALEGRESFSHSEYIKLSTVENRLKSIISQLEMLGNLTDKSSVENFNNLWTTLISAADEATKLLNAAKSGELTVETTSSGEINKIMVDDKSRDLIAILDKLYSEVSYFANMALSPQLTGDIFEKVLQALGSEKRIETLIDEELNEIFSQKTAGASVVRRGSLINYDGFTIEGKTKSSGDSEDIKQTVSYEVYGPDGTSHFTVGGEFAAKQGKMDVNFVLPDVSGKQGFRISAKNWSAIDSSHGFGETDIESALIRTSGLNPTLAFGLQVGYFENTDAAMHNYARMAIVLDILMGYSQENNYADTIVINDRANREIKVFSMSSLLQNVMNSLSILETCCVGYSPQSVIQALRQTVDFTTELGGQLNLILVALAQLKVSVSSKILQLQS